MGGENPPIGICNVCGARVARGDEHLFQQRFCRRKGCSGGIYKSHPSRTDWGECANCGGRGCTDCKRSGWEFLKPVSEA